LIHRNNIGKQKCCETAEASTQHTVSCVQKQGQQAVYLHDGADEPSVPFCFRESAGTTPSQADTLPPRPERTDHLGIQEIRAVTVTEP